jgi:hypothetical protein
MASTMLENLKTKNLGYDVKEIRDTKREYYYLLEKSPEIIGLLLL